MYKKVLLGLCFFSIFIFDELNENIFIIIFSIGSYRLFLDNDLKGILKSLIISYLILNILVIGLFQDNLELKEIELYSKKQVKKAIVLVHEGEDRKYNLKERAREVYQKNGIYSFAIIGYNLNKYKKMYSEIGSSQFKDKSYIAREKLSEKLGEDYIVVNTSLYTKPYLENTLIDLINKGYKDITICPIFLTEGKDYELLKRRIDSMEILKYGIDIKITDLFWNSSVLAKAYKDTILNSIKNENENVGILLVGLKDKNNLDQDILFREKIKKYISDEKGYNIKIKLPLLENYKKDIIKAGDELLEYGIGSLYLVIPTSVFETVYVKALAEHILSELNISNGTKFYYIAPLNEEDIIIEELYKKIRLAENKGGI